MNYVKFPVLNKLNPLLKLAILAGVESTVCMHIQRGDDINARDGAGLTPLMLAASKNKDRICSLLLCAGADPILVDSMGRDAKAIALANNAVDSFSVIESFSIEVIDTRMQDHESAASEKAAAVLIDWEAEEEDVVPQGDDSLAKVSIGLNQAIADFKPADDAEDWNDVVAFIPEWATPLQKIDDNDSEHRLRNLFLRAIREGSVPRDLIEELCEKYDRSRNAEAEALLMLVLGDLCAETDERFETEENFEVEDITENESSAVSDALTFLSDLGSSRNEPYRLYIRDIHPGKLLTAEEEVSLAQKMEEGAVAALDALASWPDGVSAILAVAERVKLGEADFEFISKGIESESVDDGSVISDDGDELDGNENDEDTFSEKSTPGSPDSKFFEQIGEIRNLAGFAGKGGIGQRALRSSLASTNISMRFLSELAVSTQMNTDAAIKFRRAIDIYSAARNRMISSNLRLSISVVKRYQGNGLVLDDLVQEGNIGLIKAVDRFDWRKGFRFSTYATWWIRQQATRAIADQGKTIRTPVHVHEKILKISHEAKEIEFTTGRKATVDVLAKRLSMTTTKVMALLTCTEEPVTLYEYELDAEGNVPAEYVPDQSFSPHDLVIRDELVRVFSKIFSGLDQRMADVLKLRNGLGVEDSFTLEEIGERFGVTRERIRQIESKGIEWMSRHERRELLFDFMYDNRDQKSENSRDFVVSQTITEGSLTNANHDNRHSMDVKHHRSLLPVRNNSEKHRVNSDSVNFLSDTLQGRKSGKQEIDNASVVDAHDRQKENEKEAKSLVRPVLIGVNRVIDMAREIGVTVVDNRDAGGRIQIRLLRSHDAKTRSLAKTLISSGFVQFPGGYQK
jgi:RNA polymerase primary sigma factor